jgi:hypothetical protein
LNWYNPTADLTASTAATYGWPNWASGTGLVPNSWAVAGKNIVTLWQSYTLGCPVTSQNCLSLNYQTSSSYISRPFLLMPGYYEVSYDYQASLKYTDTTGTYCGPTPMAASYSYLASLPTSTAINRFTPWFQRSTPADNTIAVFASHPGLVSTPNPVPFNTTTTYMNPGSSAPSTTATYPPNSINLQAYDARQKNPLIDICTFSSTAVTRRATIKITKPAYYWITFASFSSTTSISGAIGNIALKVVGGPYAKPPSGVITVPVPGGQPNSTGSFVGFTTVQNEFAP